MMNAGENIRDPRDISGPMCEKCEKRLCLARRPATKKAQRCLRSDGPNAFFCLFSVFASAFSLHLTASSNPS